MILRSLFENFFGDRNSDARGKAMRSALLSKASALCEQKQFDLAENSCIERISADRTDIDAWLMLARVRAERLDWIGAKAALDEVIRLRPDLAHAYVLRGRTYQARRAYSPAIRDYVRATELEPEDADAHLVLADAYYLTGDFERALVFVRRALQLQSDSRSAQLKLGLLLREMGDYQAAEMALRGALVKYSGDFEMRTALAMILIDQGSFAPAEHELIDILREQPANNEARWQLGILCLMTGDFVSGWQNYDSRLQRPDVLERPYRFRAWDGSYEAGAVLVYAEQALGDDILFASCLPDVIAGVGHCVVECDPKLTDIFRRSFPTATVHGSKHEQAPAWLDAAPTIKAQIAAGSLPGLFRNELTHFPRHNGYLHADISKVERWKMKLEELGRGLKVAIAWTGGGIKTRRRIRSIPLATLLPILKVPSTHFVSLQYLESAAELADLRRNNNVDVHHWPEAIESYDETAALLQACDLLITVCTAAAHLAGAMGKRVWILAPFSAEWRYLRRGECLPWYPSARVFRQQQPGDWSPVIANAAAELMRLERQ